MQDNSQKIFSKNFQKTIDNISNLMYNKDVPRDKKENKNKNKKF